MDVRRRLCTRSLNLAEFNKGAECVFITTSATSVVERICLKFIIHDSILEITTPGDYVALFYVETQSRT